jgi:small subunit ribosomal protein S17
MADDEKNETTEETPEAEAVSDTTETVDEAGTVEEVSDAPAADETPAEAEAVSDTPAADGTAAAEDTPAVAEAPVAPAKKPKSLKHVPRGARRTRSKTTREKPATRKSITRLPKPESELGRRQERRGVVVSDKGDKTIVVKVDVIKSHAKYKKVIRRAVKFHAHDEANTAGVGDTVRIVETRPLSKTKRWRLAEIVEKAR